MASSKETRAAVVAALKTNLGISKIDDHVIDHLADRYELELQKYREPAIKKAVTIKAVAEAMKAKAPATP